MDQRRAGHTEAPSSGVITDESSVGRRRSREEEQEGTFLQRLRAEGLTVVEVGDREHNRRRRPPPP
ncbi:hypothetical protein AAW14_09100 [Streptomyces hygroscopicus]|nr:hypothetical protein [Streptomyces hygroscopicus]